MKYRVYALPIKGRPKGTKVHESGDKAAAWRVAKLYRQADSYVCFVDNDGSETVVWNARGQP